MKKKRGSFLVTAVFEMVHVFFRAVWATGRVNAISVCSYINRKIQ